MLRILSPGLGFSFALVLACSDSQAALAPLAQDQVGHSITQAGSRPEFRPGLESELGRLSLQFPSFAGYFLDRTGNLVVRLTSPNDGTAIRKAVRSSRAIQELEQRQGVVPSIALATAEFTFLQLNDWRNRISALVVALPGVTFVDLDEMNNSITIGVENPSVTGTIQAVVEDAGVPLEAIAIEAAGAIQTQEVLSGPVRPLVGGLEIHPSFCTFGFNALW